MGDGTNPVGSVVARRRRWWAAATLMTLLTISLSVALGGHRRHDPGLDIFDEGAHYAYVMSLRSGHVPAWGDRLTVSERSLFDCIERIPPPPAPCGAPAPSASHYAAAGYDYEAQQPPIGYLPYVLAAAPSHSPSATTSAARHGGIVWVVVSGGLILAFAAAEGLSVVGLVALLCTCLLAPVFTYASATVNNDSAGVAAGALALLVWSLSKRHPRWSIWLGLTSGTLIGFTKGTYVAIPFALVIAAIVEEPSMLRRPADLIAACRRHACVVAMFISCAVSFAGWMEIQKLRARVSPSIVLHALLDPSHVSHFHPGLIGDGFVAGLSVFAPYTHASSLNYVWGLAAFGILTSLIFVRGAVSSDRWARGLAAGVLAAMLALAVGWPVLVFIQGHFGDFARSRYSIPLLPLVGYAIVRSCRRLGILTVGIALPLACAGIQLWVTS